MTSKLTKEWLQHQISAIQAVGITDSNTLAAFKLALAALDSEPVAWLRNPDQGFHLPMLRLGSKDPNPNFVNEEFYPVYAAPQPEPVVPQDVLEALQKVARIRLDMNDFDGDRRGIADCLGDAEEALIEVVNRRAAMLAAATQEVKGE
ncbi:hypothetical protein [Klebsiella pneumoniae]|uniref:hypothetical protein n=1 Tax=Klebsiella pneumoniae TaxID=573 RepID=UPI000E2BEE12|nr:hypothetical protein [Klebsiella pneumoniae]MCE0155041.1 hypothetical protein [Klebsiella pneumoniae]SYI33215.1 Uncharacterised protein [Klebsiella pneumoniae]HDV0352806.1 hypothetical protein [Klebsiella pneumoniae]